ncbi:hypothetical protein HRI_004861800 [Hibiscus trionum]|uniref:Uncharacterized protein n=1 Tax=Hibiscus trionum TaxID=183268 RepID=A0A9W7JC97_HIBTR|nr:hypothetical protein HRI_004861800 [Hibiscus trionum]
MAAPPARARADYDYLIKHLLIGDSAYYRGVMGIFLVYDVTDESSFNNIWNWIHNIEQHASDNVNKVLVGNKADMDESKRAVATSQGQALADEYGIKFFKTSANVEEVFFSIATGIKQRLTESDNKPEAFSLFLIFYFSLSTLIVSCAK